MGYNLSLNNTYENIGQTKPGKGSLAVTFGRVVDVILNEKHAQYRTKGGGIAINGVFFKPLTSNASEIGTTDLPFAYQGGVHIKTVPLIGELIKVETLPVPSDSDVNTKTRKFYTQILNLWNNSNNNFYPDTINNPDIDFTQGSSFLESGDINPIGSSPGDIQFEGRQGQSIRFTGGKSSTNPWVDATNIGKPMLILSNGQKETDNGFIVIGEDINEDSSSIYMVSDHKIPLKQASEKRDTYEQLPEKADQFKGNQVVINGGRLFFNAKEHDIQLSSIKSIGLNTEGSVNIDSKQYTCVDGSKIFLGKKARTSPDSRKEPVILGNQLELFLESILNVLEGMSSDMAKAKTIDGKPIPLLNKRGMQAKPVINALKNLINPNGTSQLKSKKVYTE